MADSYSAQRSSCGEREVIRTLLERDHQLIRAGQVALSDNCFAGRDFENFITGGLHAHLIRPDRKDDPARFGKLARERQWIERSSTFSRASSPSKTTAAGPWAAFTPARPPGSWP